MSTGSKHELLLRDFGKRVGIDNLALNGRNDVRIVFNGQAVDIRYDPEKDMILIASAIAGIDAGDNGFLLANVLELNLAHALTGNGTVGLDRRDNKLHYVNYIAIGGLESVAFCNLMAASLRTIGLWVKAVKARTFFEQPVSFGQSPASDPISMRRV